MDTEAEDLDTSPIPIVAELDTEYSDDHSEGRAVYYDGETTIRIIGDENGEYENAENRPLGWLNSARITTDPDDDAVHCLVSVGDPRGAFCFTVRRLPDGRMVIHMPHPGEGMPHMETEQLHAGTLLVK